MSNQRKNQKKQNLSARKPQELSYVLSQLDSFATIVGYGYSESNWQMATDIYKGLQGHLMPSDREILADLLRESYVCRNQARTLEQIGMLKGKLEGGQ